MGVMFILSLLALMALPMVHSWLAEWVKLNPNQRIAPRRSGHTSFGELDQHYIFGGYAEEDGPKRYVVNDLWHWKDDSWQSIEQSGDVPGPRLVSAAAKLGDKAYMFGGWDPQTEGTGGVILDDVYELDLPTHEWKRIGQTFPDGPCSRHVAVALHDQVLIHNHRCEGYVHLFDPARQSFQKQPTTGTCPSPRGLHAAVAVTESTLAFFGGAAQDGTMSREAFALDIEKWQWKSLAMFPDTARAAPCLCKLNDHCVILFGGAEGSYTGLNPRGDVWLLDLVKNEWTCLIKDGVTGAPPPRNAASLAKVDDNSFLLSGGWSPFKQTWDDCYVLKVAE